LLAPEPFQPASDRYSGFPGKPTSDVDEFPNRPDARPALIFARRIFLRLAKIFL
jgi:hypothetical protein